MTVPIRRVRLADVCRLDRFIVVPETEMARRLRYLGLENVESGTGRIALNETAPQEEGASATFRFDVSHVLYGKLRPYLNKVALPMFEGRCTTEILPIKPLDHIERDYLALILRSEGFVNAGVKSSVGSRMPRANWEELLGFEFDLPPITEQRAFAKRIRTILVENEKSTTGLHDQLSDAEKLPRAILVEEFSARAPIQATRIDQVPSGWNVFLLQSLARLESGHTPSRRHPEWWGGSVPWLALPDIRKLHGKIAQQTTENTNDLGIANSSARLLPVNTVCLCRDASIGFVTMLGRPMATSQHFCNWICDPEKLDAEFLMYAFMASHDYLRVLGSGSVLKTIYMPTIESFHVCAPDLPEQKRIARRLRERLAAAEALQSRLKERLAEIERLPQRILAAAFGTS